METNILNKLGLNDNEIIVYEELLQSGQQKASQISKKTPLKRGLVYKTLEDLEQKGLIIREDDKNTVSTFSPIHPNVLKGIAENKAQEALEAKESIQKELGSLISMYNLANNKPGVEFYEGVEGMEKVLNDILTATETVYTIIDLKAFPKQTNIQKRIKNYTNALASKKIKQKLLLSTISESKNNLSLYNFNTTEIKTLPEKIHLNSTIHLYDNKLSQFTLQKNSEIGIIITDQNIYQTNRKLFNILWEISTPL